MLRVCKKAAGVLLTLAIIMGLIVPGAAMRVLAAGTQVDYTSDDFHNQMVTDSGETYQVYCIAEGRPYSTSNGPLSNVRIKYAWNDLPEEYNTICGNPETGLLPGANFTYALSWAILGGMYDSNGNPRTDLNQAFQPNSSTDELDRLAQLLKNVFYYGETDGHSATEIQDAIYQVIFGGNVDSLPTAWGEGLAAKAWNGPDKPETELWVYLPDPQELIKGNEMGYGIGNLDQALVRGVLKTASNPAITNTTAKINGTTGTVEITKGDEATMTDVVEFEGLEDGKTYKMVSFIFKDGEQFDSVETDVTADKSPCTVTFTKKITEAGTYSVKTELTLDGEVVATHNGSLDVASETVKVTVKEERELSIGTTVSATPGEYDKKIEAVRVKYDDLSKKVSVTDTIAYEGLLPGVKYTVKGRLVEVIGKEGNYEVVAETKEGLTKTAEAESGMWKISFGKVKLKPFAKYVVFEEVYSDDDEMATEESHEDTTHEDVDDKAQTILTEDEEGYVLGDKRAPEYSGKLATTVSAGGKSATTDKVLSLTSTEAKAITRVTDTIAYSGMQGGDTYEVTGKLMKVADDGTATQVGNPVTQELIADESGSGMWVMTFSNVKLEAGSKYVVFESAANTDASKTEDVAEHADIEDKAQTIVVASSVTPTKNATSPKTGEPQRTIPVVGVMLIIVIGAALMIRRQKA